MFAHKVIDSLNAHKALQNSWRKCGKTLEFGKIRLEKTTIVWGKEVFCIIRRTFGKEQPQTQNPILISGFICSYHSLVAREETQTPAAYDANP